MKTLRCSCDDFADDPCPVHARENAKQNKVLALRKECDLQWFSEANMEARKIRAMLEQTLNREQRRELEAFVAAYRKALLGYEGGK